MTKLKPYPEYKDIGIKWIGEIPVDWNKIKIKYVADLINGYSFKSEDYTDIGIPIIRIGDVGGEIDWSKVKRLPTEKASKFERFLIRNRDILIAMTGATIGKASVFKTNKKALLNQRVGIIRARSSYDEGFMAYLISSVVFREQVLYLGHGGAQDNIGISDIGNMYLPFPDNEQQKKISCFLDLKIRSIEALIRDKRNVIKLLEEKRQAVITETVTKGLDPNVKMKYSGIDWIGEIPEHWEVQRLKYLMQLNPPKSEVDKKEEMKVTFLPMEKLLPNGKVDCSALRVIDDVYTGYTYFRENDIVMAKVTPCFENGNIALMEGLENGVGFGTTELHVLRTNSKIKEKYLYYLLRTEYFKQEGISTMYGVGGLKRIPSQFVKDYKVGIPSIEEQQDIVNYLEEVEVSTANLINNQKKVIKKLKEYRESLIYEAVTGKIDLRDYECDEEISEV